MWTKWTTLNWIWNFLNWNKWCITLTSMSCICVSLFKGNLKHANDCYYCCWINKITKVELHYWTLVLDFIDILHYWLEALSEDLLPVQLISYLYLNQRKKAICYLQMLANIEINFGSMKWISSRTIKFNKYFLILLCRYVP